MSKPVKDTGMVLKICHLYPTLMSVAADRGNLFSIQKRCEWRGRNGGKFLEQLPASWSAGLQGNIHRQPMRQVNLINIAAADVALGARDGGNEFSTSEVG